MKKVFISIILIVVILVIYYFYNNTQRLQSLTTEISKTTDASYDSYFIVEKGSLLKFPGFELFAMGEEPLSFGDKVHNWWVNIRGYLGGSISETYHFQLKSKDGQVVKEISISEFPYSWESFTIKDTFTLLPYFGGGEGAYYLVSKGDLEAARTKANSVQPAGFSTLPFPTLAEISDSGKTSFSITSKQKQITLYTPDDVGDARIGIKDIKTGKTCETKNYLVKKVFISNDEKQLVIDHYSGSASYRSTVAADTCEAVSESFK